MTTPDPVPSSTEAQGVTGPAAETPGSGGHGTESKDSGELSSPLLGLAVPATQPLWSSAPLDSSSSSSSRSSGPNPSTSFESITADPTGVL